MYVCYDVVSDCASGVSIYQIVILAGFSVGPVLWLLRCIACVAVMVSVASAWMFRLPDCEVSRKNNSFALCWHIAVGLHLDDSAINLFSNCDDI